MTRFFISALALFGMGVMATEASAQFSVYKDGKVVFTMPETPDYVDFTYNKPTTGTENGHDWVDLGLTSRTRWATCNVGADAPQSAGDYYQWGETETHYSAGGNTDTPTWKEGYSAGYNWSTYKWCNGSNDTQTKYCTYSSYGTVDNKKVLDDADDVAVQTWGGAWRMPTKTQQDELRKECDWEWTSINGVNGYKVKSRVNDNFIFLPAAGDRWDTDLYGVGYNGLYWSRSLSTNSSDDAYGLGFDSYYILDWTNYERSCGISVRPVCPGLQK